MSWYRTGTVTVTNGSKTVTGVGTLFTTAVNVGDAFAIVDANLNPTGAWYEVDVVVSNTELTLKQTYAGTTGSNNQYAVFNLVGNMTTPSFAQRLATFFASFQSLIDKPTATPTALGIPVADANGDIDSGWIKEASTTAKGIIELATTDEVKLGADNERAVTPAGFKAAFGEFYPTGLTPTYISTTSFSVAGNQTAIFTVGRVLKITDTGGTVYAVVKSSAYTTITTVTIAGDTIDSGISAVLYSVGQKTSEIWESGSNANGKYVKFADGTAICFMSYFASIPMEQYISGSGLYHGYFEKTMPMTFSSIWSGFGGGVDNECIGILTYATATTTTKAAFYYFSRTISVTATVLHFGIIGRWY